MPKLYHYNADTGEYTGRESEARLDPIGGEPLVPAGATLIPPPACEAGHIACWQDGEWIVTAVVDSDSTDASQAAATQTTEADAPPRASVFSALAGRLRKNN